MKSVASVGALFLCLSAAFLRSSHAEADAQNACAEAAFNEYNRQNLAILTSPAAVPVKSVELIVAQRRLQEQYCLKFAMCTVGDPDNKSLDLSFRAAFSHCISDEEKADNE